MATILIVDPDAANRSLLELLCLRLGHRPIGSREWIAGEEPDLMLLEPVFGPGMRLARGVRRRFPQVPILCVSIDGPNPQTRELSTIGHVMKPFRRFDLERALEAALGETAETGETARRPGLGARMSRAFAGGHSPFLPARATP